MGPFLVVFAVLFCSSPTAWISGPVPRSGEICGPPNRRVRPLQDAPSVDGDGVPTAGYPKIAPSIDGDVSPSLDFAENAKFGTAAALGEWLKIQHGVDEDDAAEAAEKLLATLKLLGITIGELNVGTLSQLLSNNPKETPREQEIQQQQLPFDVSHIHSIELDDTWTDESMGMDFVGRHDFSQEVASEILRLFRNPPADDKTATALVYSSVSGIGKTVSMLQLKKTLPFILPQWQNVVVAYLGFNSGLQLGAEEWNHMGANPLGGEGAKEVLARRLLASVLLSKKYGEVITWLPKYRQVYGGRGFPTVDQSLEMLLEELGASPKNPFYIVAGVDEVQRLDAQERTFGGAELGRYLIWTLASGSLNGTN